MACKGCGDKNIGNPYKCNSCHIDKGSFKWCVITKVPPEDDPNGGNLYDEVVEVKNTNRTVSVHDGKNFLELAESAMINFKMPVFRQGEIFPIEPDFERELGYGRKAGKWSVEYEIFNSTDYKTAIRTALKASKTWFHTPDNLELLELKYEEKVQLTEKQQKLKASDDPFKLIYGWIKQGHITMKESKVLLREIYEKA